MRDSTHTAAGNRYSGALSPDGGNRPLLRSSSRLGVHAQPRGAGAALQSMPSARAALASPSDAATATLEDVRGTDLRLVLEPGANRGRTAQRSFFCRTSSSTYSVQNDQDETDWCQYDNAVYGDMGVG